ncbi:uncharacterized protein LOC117110328 isoform X2 [Anneissia japonica]|nr:uncharacterized protein LOC117110328 isoform X2 [Anneissia japonica]XP_033108913.1 uncharacterized protein LOC117110328 isoform X2 [Anneissia japonica]XP_033108922.1 uncharacterized protein LOC117110328 isoform X2 [Anneissia japonica]XP_033108932.1 uncharacterized protein LOC117110328 isoform X2 [Anneissia japonica]XP_033108937.1 uncharacterized protein LOC117110328 isoform X2 [Anneissia japonica]
MKRSEVEELVKKIEESPEKIDSYIKKLITAVDEFDEEEDVNEKNLNIIADVVEDHVAPAAEKCKSKKSGVMAKLAVALAKRKMTRYYRSINDILRERSIVNWKDQTAEAIMLVETFVEPPEIRVSKRDEDWNGKDHPEKSDSAEKIMNCVDKMVEAFQRDKITKKVGTHLLDLLIKCLKGATTVQIKIVEGLTDDWDFNVEGAKAKELIPELFKALDDWYRQIDEVLSSEDDHFQHKPSEKSLEIAFKSNCPVDKYMKHVVSIWNNTLTKELDGQPLTGWGSIATTILSSFIISKATSIDMSEFVPGIMRLLKSDIELLKSLASGVIATMYQKIDALVPCADDVVDVFINDDDMDYIGMALKPLYAKCPEKIIKKIDIIIESLGDMDSSKKGYVYMLLDDISKSEPQVFLPHLDVLMEDLNDPNLQFQVLMVLGEVAAKYPEKFVDKVDILNEILVEQPMAVYHVDKIIASVGTIDKGKAKKIMKILAEQLQTVQVVYQSVVMMEMKRIGHKYPECLSEYRKEIEAMKDSPQMGVGDMVVALIDFMEGRTLEALHEDITEQRDDIDNLDSRVTTTEKNVTEVTEKVDKQGEEITAVQNDVATQGQKLEELEEVVDETVVKVDEIDHKTITNAPKWSRDVSKLLNPEGDYDWRFLAIRLGYSGEDIRNWALSPDPTMAILAEWYTTHKSSDATYAILTALEDMGQTEAVKIIEESLEQADAMVPKSGPDISEKPPKVFISYQWDHQPEVKAIRDHLEMAGFDCWMDIGQMGGGDNLYAKINQGMRAAKVVLCMTTEKYSKSENCNKEVNLANLLNKPIIPILIEQTAWPPEGPMSMLFAQLLYIQFFTKEEYVRGEKFWPDSKFSELLGQVSYYAAPDPTKITDEYKSWVPSVEAPSQEIKRAAGEETANVEKKVEDSQAPVDTDADVFISYQWDHQPQIKKLYQRLTDLGYSCWLDIKQMGGGDPLYSKIDKGLRKAKVVISCVTPKYSLSANCRREVSLSDALRRPIIPILLQQMTWPPEGPMSMTFTQLLYIDFTKESSQKNFDDGKFDELVEKISEHAQPEASLPAEKKDEHEVKKTPDQTPAISNQGEPKPKDPAPTEKPKQDPPPQESKADSPSPELEKPKAKSKACCIL